MTRDDDPGRTLSAAETRLATEHDAALRAAAHYIKLTAHRSAGSLAEAGENDLPLEPLRGSRPTGADPEHIRMGLTGLYVSPRGAHAYLSRARPETVRGVGVAALGRAVEFMGARPAVTILGRAETGRTSPWRNHVGWWRLSQEMVLRLHFDHFVPSLRGLPGREATAPLRTDGLRSSARAAQVSPDTAAGVITVMLRHAVPTALLSIAVEHRRPLVPRRRGRPSRAASAAFDTGLAIWPATTIHDHLRDHGADYQVAGLNRVGDTAALLAALADRHPQRFEVISHVRVPDRDGSVRAQHGYLRCDLAALGLPAWDDYVLRNEFIGWRDARMADHLAGVSAGRNTRRDDHG